MNRKQQAFVQAAGDALFGKGEKWLGAMARAIGDNVYERQIRRALMDEPLASLEDKDMKRLRTLLEQRQRAITAALAKFDGVLAVPEKEAA